VVLVDAYDATVITGSFNFTKAAEENNAENLLIIRNKVIAEKYTSNWDKHVEHSELYEGKEKGYSETQASQSVASGFVASARSQVFHKADCKSAAKISAKNLVNYATRDEAIQAGKKPCGECKP
jgi:phosphatidylserine/phosphatidylglycerophosphate/cardiolipin synthase-like enzyme